MNKHRQDPSKPWSFLDPEEWDKCCKEEEPGAADTQRECVEEWKQKLSDARKVMEEARAQYDKANKSHINAASWKAKLEKWKKDAEAAHDKAVDVYHELVRFREAVGRTKTVETARALKAVLCLVKYIFDRVDDLLHVSSSVDDSPGEIQKLKQWIECNESLDAGKKEKALTCIVPFEDQMKTVNGAQEDLLTKLLDILHTANVLMAVVDKPDRQGAEEKDGLKWQIVDLINRISGKTAYTHRERRCGAGGKPTPSQPPCQNEIVNPPEPLFPIRKMDGSTDSEYYRDIVTLFNEAEDKEKATKKDLDKAEMDRNEAEAYYNGLNDAITAAEAAKPAK